MSADWGHFKIQILRVILKILNQPRETSCVVSEVERACQKVGHARGNLQSHTAAESEVISSDAGARMDGLLALNLWDLVIKVSLWSVRGNTSHSDDLAQGNLRCETCEKQCKVRTKQKNFLRRSCWEEIDDVSLSAKQSLLTALLQIHENNEAVISDDYWRPTSHKETCIPHPQSCTWLVVWPDQPWPYDPTEISSTPKTDSQTPIFFRELTRSGKNAKFKVHLKEKNLRAWLQKSRPVRNMTTSSLTSRSPQESDSLSSATLTTEKNVALLSHVRSSWESLSTEKPAALKSHDATVNRSSDAWRDETWCDVKPKFEGPAVEPKSQQLRQQVVQNQGFSDRK